MARSTRKCQTRTSQSFSVQEVTRSTTSSSRLRGFGAPVSVSCFYLTYPAKESVWCALFDGCGLTGRAFATCEMDEHSECHPIEGHCNSACSDDAGK